MATEPLNLWELMTSAASSHPSQRKRALIEALVAELSQCGASGQEMTIEADPRGWLLKVFSCFDDHDWEIRILIPSGRADAVQVEYVDLPFPEPPEPPFRCCEATWRTVEEWRMHASPECRPFRPEENET